MIIKRGIDIEIRTHNRKAIEKHELFHRIDLIKESYTDKLILEQVEDIVKTNPEFKIVEPAFPFNEGNINFRVTHWPSAFIQKLQ